MKKVDSLTLEGQRRTRANGRGLVESDAGQEELRAVTKKFREACSELDFLAISEERLDNESNKL